MSKIKCFDCTFAFITFSEIMPDTLCTNEKITKVSLDTTWNKNLRNSKRPRYCKGFNSFSEQRKEAPK